MYRYALLKTNDQASFFLVRTVAENVANTMNHIVDATNRSIPWVQSVLQLLEDYYIESDSLPEIITIADYLDRCNMGCL